MILILRHARFTMHRTLRRDLAEGCLANELVQFNYLHSTHSLNANRRSVLCAGPVARRHTPSYSTTIVMPLSTAENRRRTSRLPCIVDRAAEPSRRVWRVAGLAASAALKPPLFYSELELALHIWRDSSPDSFISEHLGAILHPPAPRLSDGDCLKLPALVFCQESARNLCLMNGLTWYTPLA